MKIRELFDLLGAAEDFLSFWDGVETVDQVVSRLEHLKRAAPEDLLEDLQTLRICTTSAFAANLELGGSLDESPKSDDNDDLGLGDLLSQLESPEGDLEPKTEQMDKTTEAAGTPSEKTTTS